MRYNEGGSTSQNRLLFLKKEGVRCQLYYATLMLSQVKVQRILAITKQVMSIKIKII